MLFMKAAHFCFGNSARSSVPKARRHRLHGRRDRRCGQAWTLRQRIKNDLIWAIAATAIAAVRPLSPNVLRHLGRTLGLQAHSLARRSRSIALKNVARAMPGLSDAARCALVRSCFLTLGELLAETVALLGARDWPPPLAMTEHARATLAAAQADGRGVIFASAHLGPWERVAASIVASGFPLVALARESYDPRFSALTAQIRTRTGVRTIWRSESTAASKILRTLRAGELLGVTMDLRSRVAACEAAFLGHPAPTAVGPAKIALRTGAAVVVGTAAPHISATPGPGCPLVVTATRIATDGLTRDDAGAVELTTRINAELSRRILALPHAWVWMHARWRDEPSV